MITTGARALRVAIPCAPTVATLVTVWVREATAYARITNLRLERAASDQIVQQTSVPRTVPPEMRFSPAGNRSQTETRFTAASERLVTWIANDTAAPE
ncbi:MAG: hypothetical protein WCD11_00475 [Solirubrobacteraceae bacterium]